MSKVVIHDLPALWKVQPPAPLERAAMGFPKTARNGAPCDKAAAHAYGYAMACRQIWNLLNPGQYPAYIATPAQASAIHDERAQVVRIPGEAFTDCEGDFLAPHDSGDDLAMLQAALAEWYGAKS